MAKTKAKTKAKSADKLTWEELNIGSIMTEPGSAEQYKTGDWRSEKPILDLSKCNKCGLCYIFCPDGCFKENAEGYFLPNMFHCKGCGICAMECPRDVITMVEEEEA